MGKVVKVKNLYIGQGKPKICAIVLGETVSEILAMVEQANQIDCDLIEFRADFYANILDPEKAKDVAAKVRHACRKPIIFTCRRKEEGGKQAIGLDAYKKLLKMVSDCYYAELIDVEASAIPDDKSLWKRSRTMAHMSSSPNMILLRRRCLRKSFRISFTVVPT